MGSCTSKSKKIVHRMALLGQLVLSTQIMILIMSILAIMIVVKAMLVVVNISY